MAWVSLTNIEKSLDGVKILDKVNLDIEKGEMIALLGPSGCGKSTTLRIIAGILSADGGEVYVAGRPVGDVPANKRGAVLVFQDYLLFPHLTVEKNIAFGLKAQKVDNSVISATVAELIKMVELSGEEKKYPYQLSGGQQQRVAIARALAVTPDILLLDEPFSNLDPILRESMQEFVKRIHEQTGTTTIIVTHSKEEAFKMCSKVAVMFDGKVEQTDTAYNLYTKPKTLRVAEFLGVVNKISATVKSGMAVTAFGSCPVDLTDGDYEFAVRPEDITAGGEMGGVVRDVVFMGEKFRYTVEAENVILILDTHPTGAVSKPGESITFTVNLEGRVFESGV